MSFENKNIAVVGVGGLGGFVAEYLAREKVSQLILIDGDNFSESNINRQLLCTTNTIGQGKVDLYLEHISTINNETQVITVREFLNKDTASILDSCDLVFDCLDNLESRLFLENYCEEKNIALIHGAIGNKTGHACLVLPHDKLISKIYQNSKDEKSETTCNAVATIASLQIELANKFFNNKIDDLKNKLILVDLDDLEIKKVNI